MDDDPYVRDMRDDWRKLCGSVRTAVWTLVLMAAGVAAVVLLVVVR